MVSCIGAWDGLPRYRSGIRIANPAFARSMCHWLAGMTASIRVFMHQRAVHPAWLPVRAAHSGSEAPAALQLQQAGRPSWTRIEPCAWRRSHHFGGCLRKSGGCGSPPDAEAPSVKGNWSARMPPADPNPLFDLIPVPRTKRPARGYQSIANGPASQSMVPVFATGGV